MANGDAKVWNLANVIITVMAGVIAVLVGAGYNSLSNKIELGDAAIHMRLARIEDSQRNFNDAINKLQTDVTRIDTLQKIRIDREAREENRKREGQK